MTIKELQIIMDKSKKEAEELYNDANMLYKKKLDKIQNKAYELNNEVGFYEISDMEYDEFLNCMRRYKYEERMQIAYSFFQHIRLLDNIIFDFEEGEE